MTEGKRVVGKWILDGEQSVFAPKSFIGRVPRTHYEFFADGSYVAPHNHMRGIYSVDGAILEARCKSMGQFQGITSHVELWKINDDASTLSHEFETGTVMVLVRADSVRGTELWQRAFERPEHPNRDEFTELVLVLLRETLGRADVVPGMLIGKGGLEMNPFAISDFMSQVSRYIQDKYGAQIGVGTMLSDSFETVGEFTEELFSAVSSC